MARGATRTRRASTAQDASRVKRWPDLKPAIEFIRSRPTGSACAVIGSTGLGKSYLLHKADEAGAFRQRLVYDVFLWEDLDQSYPWRGENLTTDELLDRAYSEKRLFAHGPKINVGPTEEDDYNDRLIADGFAAVAEVARHHKNLDLIAEECGLWSQSYRPKRKYPSAGKKRETVEIADESDESALAPILRTITAGGRHLGLRLFTVVQSAHHLSKSVRSYITSAVIFDAANADELREFGDPELWPKVQELAEDDPPILWTRPSRRRLKSVEEKKSA